MDGFATPMNTLGAGDISLDNLPCANISNKKTKKQFKTLKKYIKTKIK